MLAYRPRMPDLAQKDRVHTNINVQNIQPVIPSDASIQEDSKDRSADGPAPDLHLVVTACPQLLVVDDRMFV